MADLSSFFSGMYFGNSILEYSIFFGILLGVVIGAKIFYWFSQVILKKLTQATKNNLDDLLIDMLEEPIVFGIFIAGVYTGTYVLNMTEAFQQFYMNVIGVMITICIAWLLIRTIDALLIEYVTPMAAKSKTDLDDHVLPILRKMIKITISCIAFILILSNFGYDVTSIIAGLGIGGLAFALAAKDLLGNLFGGVSVIADKPFSLGDVIEINGELGTVKEIGLRTTKITTFDGTELIVPNAKFTDGIIENKTRAPEKKITLEIGVTYDTSSAKMKKGKEIIEKILKKQKGIKHEKTKIHFTEFGDFALKIKTMYYISDKSNWLDIQDTVNFEIKQQFEKAKIDMAFPTQTIEVIKKK